MKHYLIFLILLLISCNPNSKNSERLSDNDRTNYGKIDDKNLPLKFGDLVEFKIGDSTVKAIVLDILQENNENLFGLCFVNDNRIFGLRIPSGLGGDCVDLCDLTFIGEKELSNYKIIGKLNIDFDKVSPGSYSPVRNINDILSDFNMGINQRKKLETPCEKKLTTLDPVNEIYLPLSKFEK